MVPYRSNVHAPRAPIWIRQDLLAAAKAVAASHGGAALPIHIIGRSFQQIHPNYTYFW